MTNPHTVTDPASAGTRKGLVRGRGTAGMAAVLMALVACYGTLALAALLPLLGLRLAVNEAAWSGAILLFVLLAVAAIVAGMRRHQSLVPVAAAAIGGGLVAYALLVDYQVVVELAGFGVLAWAAWRDAILRRRERRAEAY